MSEKDRLDALYHLDRAMELLNSMIICDKIVVEPPVEPALNGCDSVLSGSSNTFSWTDPDQTAATIYDFWLGTTPQSNNIYDLAGGGTFNANSINVTGLPTDGSTIYKTLYIFRDGAGTTPILVECTCTAATIASNTTKSLDIPAVQDTNVTNADIDSWMGGDLRFFIRAENTEVQVVNGEPCWIANHVPDGSGSAGILGVCNLPPENCYTVEETITLSDNFDFGNGSIGIKVGAGFVGGTNGSGGLVTGGSTATTGFSARPVIVADIDGDPCFAGYLYYANRPGMPSTGTIFGDEVKANIEPVPGGTYTIKQQVCLNDAGQNNGTYKMWIDGALKIDESGIRWMDGTPVIDGMVFSSFHGGSTSAYDPNTTVQIEYKNISVSTP